MTTNSSEGGDTASPEPAPRPAGRRRLLHSPGFLAFSVAVVGAVLAAVVTPVGDHVVKAFLDEPTCPGEACEGKNPRDQGCGEGARTFKPGSGNPAQLQIRYSEDCRALWARIQRGSPGDLVTVRVDGGTERSAEIEYDDDQFTHMVGAPDGEFRVTACAVPQQGGESAYERYCIHATEATAWR
ncbi:DUF2690 domain-containing protein [Streptomyces yaizuensis]|uniref:DUF2690 domain-containing protein n=1 Tax=Streptomyces yaizuensis TaxID=2989713 RepID=A0ABQ5NX77_9ACTN|nr:DUF2690 domain-containing protein [Streptomyces sp. YSPA8]GLF94961.1 DUF2690 domain-containing protein [Streptomyces sp. YSPA8]